MRVHDLFHTSLETTWRLLPCAQTLHAKQTLSINLTFPTKCTFASFASLFPTRSCSVAEHTPKTMQSSTPMATHPAPTALAQSTETPSYLTRHQAAHAMDTKAAPRALRLPELVEKAMEAKTAHRALQIPEVLEHILVHLPIQDLFVHQRVSRTFQTSIAESPAIRRKMFLELDTKTSRESWKLVKSEKKRGRGRNRLYFYPGTDDEPGIATPVTLNPVLEVIWPGVHANTSCAQREESQDAEYVRFKVYDYTISPDSSLLAMYVSDPPCRTLVARIEFFSAFQGRSHALFSGGVELQSETGLRLRDLRDGALGAGEVFNWVDYKGVFLQARLGSLKNHLDEANRIVDVEPSWCFELQGVVVPTAEEWAAVKQRGARR